MERICTGKGIVVGINLTFGSFRCKTRSSCVYNETAEKKTSSCNFIACVNTNINWWDNNLLGVTLVANPYWDRFAIHCLDGCELIASRLSITNYDHTTFSIVCIGPEITIYSYPSTQQITKNLIECRVATGVTPSYNTTNTFLYEIKLHGK